MQSDEDFLEVDIPIPLPYIAPEEPFISPLPSNEWINLSILSDENVTTLELRSFPVEIGSVQSSFKLNDKSISPRHAILELVNGKLTITDTNSQNGVSIGDTWLKPGVPYPITVGDDILVGRTIITVLDFAGHTEILDRPQPEIITPDDILEALEAELAIIVPVLEPVDSEPEVKTVKTLKKLLEEPDATLFRAVLNMPEPEPEDEPEEEPEEEIEIRVLTSEDLGDILATPEAEEEIDADESVVELTAEDFVQALIDTDPPPEQEVELEPEPEQPEEPDIPLTAEEFIEALIEKSSIQSSTGKICTGCQAPGKSTDKFCGKCGNKLA